MTYSGAVKVILIGKETTWGTPVTTDKDIGLVQDIGDEFNREIIQSKGLGAIESQQVSSGNVELNHSFTVDAQHGRLLDYALGAAAHAETTGDWKHTFTIADQSPSFTLESAEDSTVDTTLKTSGNIITSLEISTALNQNLRFICETQAKTGISSASTTAASLSSLVVFPQSLVTVSVNTVAATEVQNASIKIIKTGNRSYGVGDVVPQQGHASDMEFEFNASLGFAAVTFQELFMGGTSPSGTPTVFEFEIDADNGTALGSGQRRVLCTLENCMGGFSKSATIGDLIFIDVTGSGTLKECFSVDNIQNTAWS